MENEVLFLTILANALAAVLVLLSFFINLRQKKRAILVLPIRIEVKMFYILCGLWVLFSFFPGSLYFIVFILSVILMFFSIDVVVEERGIYCGWTIIPWHNIKDISNHEVYLFVNASNLFSRKGLFKFFWQIKTEDIEQIQSLFREKTGLQSGA